MQSNLSEQTRAMPGTFFLGDWSSPVCWEHSSGSRARAVHAGAAERAMTAAFAQPRSLPARQGDASGFHPMYSYTSHCAAFQNLSARAQPLPAGLDTSYSPWAKMLVKEKIKSDRGTRCLGPSVTVGWTSTERKESLSDDWITSSARAI